MKTPEKHDILPIFLRYSLRYFYQMDKNTCDIFLRLRYGKKFVRYTFFKVVSHRTSMLKVSILAAALQIEKKTRPDLFFFRQDTTCKKFIARIFFHIAIAKKYRTFFGSFERNIAKNIAKISAKYQVFRAFL